VTGSSGHGTETTWDTDAVGLRVSCPDFVGRAGELELLGAALESAAGGRTSTILIAGDAGIGKTRLVEEFCGQARQRGARPATGVCVPIGGGGLPFGPVVGILRDLVRQLGESAAGGLLGRLASDLGVGSPGAGHRPSGGLVDEMAKTRLFESILVCLATLAEDAAAVLVVEDLQWADSASAELLSFLVRNLTYARVLLVGTYRSEDVDREHPLRPWLGELGRHPRVRALHLDGLARGEMTELIGGILGHPPDWALAEAVSARAQGNPFFAEELTAARHDPMLSPELQGVIMTRVDGLSKQARQLVGLAATAGTIVAHDLLVASGALDADSLHAALAEALDKGILVVDSSQSGYRFRHALLREAVYLALLPGERVALHRQLATALTAETSLGTSGPGHRAAELAAHWWGAGAWAEALEASTVAAEAAIAVWAFPEALAHLERALSVLDRLPAGSVGTGPTDRLRLLERAGDVAYLAGAAERSVELAREAIDRAGDAGDASTVARFYALLGRNAWAVGDSDAALDAYRRAAAFLPADAPSVELARLLAEEGRGLMLLSRYRDAALRCDEAVAMARAVGARAEEGHALNTLGCCYGSLGRYDEGIALLRQALTIAEELGSPEDLNRAYGNLSHVLGESGQLEQAAAMVFDSAAVGEELWGVRLNGAAGNSVDALIMLGRYDDATALLAQIRNPALGVCAPAPYLLPTAIAIRRGRFAEAAQLLATADDLTVRLADVQQRGTYHMLMAELALEEGRPGDAHAEVERALALAAGTDDEIFGPEMCVLAVRALADRVDDARARGVRFDVDKARVLAGELVQEADRLAAAPVERGGRGRPRSLAFAATCAAEQSRLYVTDADRWDEAARRWDAAHEPYRTAYCRWRQAEALLERRADRNRAGDALQEAWRLSAGCGAEPLQGRVERLAQRARLPLGDVGPGAAAPGTTLAADLGLTPREVEVLGHLAAGRTDREIGETLYISKKTASVHVSNLLRKLDVTSRVEAGRIGQAHGL